MQHTHVRLEDCFGEEHIVEIATLPDNVQSLVRLQLNERAQLKLEDKELGRPFPLFF